MKFHLAQINVGRLQAPVEDPSMAEFVDALEQINALADASPGFVWRLQDESGDATNLGDPNDPELLINMSVWDSVEALRDYVYASDHKAFLGRRKEWFQMPDGPNLALWWIEAGLLPTEAEGKAQLQHLQAHGPSAHAFTFKSLQPMPIEEKAG